MGDLKRFEVFGGDERMEQVESGPYVLFSDVEPLILAAKYILAKNEDGNALFQVNEGLKMLREALKDAGVL